MLILKVGVRRSYVVRLTSFYIVIGWCFDDLRVYKIHWTQLILHSKPLEYEHLCRPPSSFIFLGGSRSQRYAEGVAVPSDSSLQVLVVLYTVHPSNVTIYYNTQLTCFVS